MAENSDFDAKMTITRRLSLTISTQYGYMWHRTLAILFVVLCGHLSAAEKMELNRQTSYNICIFAQIKTERNATKIISYLNKVKKKNA